MSRVTASVFVSLLFAFATAFTNFAYGQQQVVAASIDEVQNNCFGNCWQGTWIYSGAWVNFDDQPYTVSGSADFAAVGQPWSFSFSTGDPIDWGGNCLGGGCTYSASYNSGLVSITGPGGLSFSGTITGAGYDSGVAYELQEHGEQSVTVTFTGDWNNGVPGYGSISQNFSFADDFLIGHYYENSASLDAFAVTPEPSAWFLVSSGFLSIAGEMRRRKQGPSKPLGTAGSS